MSEDPASHESPADTLFHGPETTLSYPQQSESESAAPVGLTPDETAAVHALPPTSALLVMQRGPSAGARFLLDAERTSAGRSTRSDIFLDDVTVSRRHAEFLRHGTSFEVKDLVSLNGTYFEGVRIETAALHDRDEVQVGKFRLTFYASRLDLAPQASE